MTIWFQSDQHHFHKKILSHSNRPFKTLEEMTEKFLENWNAVVTKDDTGYVLGDFSFGKSDQTIEIIRRMKCAQLHLILGNHDKGMKDRVKQKFKSVQHYLEINVPDLDTPRGYQPICLMHFPLLTWNKASHGSWNLHGHSHGTLKNNKGKRLDVGVDCFDYKPVSYEQVKEIMKSKEFVPEDRHGEYNETKDEE